MFARRFLVVLSMFLGAARVQAQHGASPPPNRVAPATASQFAFLVGQWELVVKPAATTLGQRVHGVQELTGLWKCWRAFDGWGVEDELRITDRSGNPVSLTHAMRFHDPKTSTWRITTLDVYRGLFNQSAAQLRNGEMTVVSRGTGSDGKAYLSRGRYTNVERDSFRFVQERSLDNGRSWKANLTIDAKRVAAAASR
jgi:hypothetical protein